MLPKVESSFSGTGTSTALVAALLFLLPLGWIAPNHYLPWLAFQGDWATAVIGCALLAAALFHSSFGAGVRITRLTAVVALASLVPLAQAAVGLIHFRGDAVMAAAYLLGFAVAITLGRTLAASKSTEQPLDGLLWGCVVFASLNVFVALCQWLLMPWLGMHAADLRPGARPFGNVGQPNQFSTICFLGLCAAGYLHARGRFGAAGFWTLGAWFLMGMVISSSRAGWLQMASLVLLMPVLGRRLESNRLSLRTGLLLALPFALATVLWPSINELLHLATGRGAGEQASIGKRGPMWIAALDAILRAPLCGYGWNQAGMAQQRVAADHGPIGAYFEHTHNLVLDLLIWNGLPLGLLLSIALFTWFARRLLACRDERVAWLLAAVGGVLVHSLVEFPLEYAYILLPVGVMIGAIDALTPNAATWQAPRRLIGVPAGLLSVLLVLITLDYWEAEQNFRVLRLESARIGVGGIVTPAAEMRLLDQLEALLTFAREEAQPKMPSERVEAMRKVAERFGHPPVLFRYALAAGLNHRPRDAQWALQTICKTSLPERCNEAREGWSILQERYPVLRQIAVPDRAQAQSPV